MKKKFVKFIPLLSGLLLCSCGYSLNELYKGNAYNSTNFLENYYKEWNPAITPNDAKSKIVETKDDYVLSSEKDLVFTSFGSENFKKCDSTSNYDYINDIDYYEDGLLPYGKTVRLAEIDKSFRYGVISKLFDGQLFCHSEYQISRVQVAPKNHLDDFSSGGFSTLFTKEIGSYSYFMMNFKFACLDKDLKDIKESITSDITLHITFYLKNKDGYVAVPVSYQINNAPTNSGDFPRQTSYVCFGFKLHQSQNDSYLNIDRLKGISVQYEINNLNIKSGNTLNEYYHSMMLYEISFPYSTWH